MPELTAPRTVTAENLKPGDMLKINDRTAVVEVAFNGTAFLYRYYVKSRGTMSGSGPYAVRTAQGCEFEVIGRHEA